MPAKQCADSVLTTVYFDIGNDCVLEFNSLQRRLYGFYEKDQQQLKIKWRISWPDNRLSVAS